MRILQPGYMLITPEMFKVDKNRVNASRQLPQTKRTPKGKEKPVIPTNKKKTLTPIKDGGVKKANYPSKKSSLSADLGKPSAFEKFFARKPAEEKNSK